MDACERVSDALELKLQAVLSSLMCVLGTKLGSSEEQQALALCTVSPDTLSGFLRQTIDKCFYFYDPTSSVQTPSKDLGKQ